MVFPVVMYGCESWTVRKAKHRKINAFELLEKTLESLGNPVDHFLLCYEPLEAEKTRLYSPTSPSLWLLLEFGQWWTKEIGESVEKKIRGLILSSDTFLVGKWPSFSTEAQSSGQKPSLLAAAYTRLFRDCNIHSLPLPCVPKSVHVSLILPVSKSFPILFKLSLTLLQLPNP